MHLLRPLVVEKPLTLFSGPPIEWPIRGGEGDEMAVTVQTQFESVVTEMYEEAFVGSSIENGTTLITFDLRNLDFQRESGITSTIDWRTDTDHVDVHELSTFHNPVKYRFIVAQGYYFDEKGQRMALVGFRGRGIGDVVQSDFCHLLVLKALIFQGA